MAIQTKTFSVDFGDIWRSALHVQHQERLVPENDRTFWQRSAATYEQRVSVPGSYDQTLGWIEAKLDPGDTLLDVGCGDGRFALPLATKTSQITAIDYSPEMLQLLMQKAATSGIENIIPVEGNWPDVDVAEHDVVLAAWSMYRQLDIERAVAQLIRTTRKTLVIAMSDAYDAPHRRLIRALVGPDHEPVEPLYLYIAGVMRKLGIRPNIQMLHETRSFQFDTLDEALEILVPGDLADDVRAGVMGALPGILESLDGRYRYSFRIPVAMIFWERREE